MWNGNKIAYIAATFFGTRWGQRRGTTNRYCNEYFAALKKYATCIDRIIIPCNIEEWHTLHYEELSVSASKFEQESGIPVVPFHRPNAHFSYGAWNMALRDFCDDIDFAFLMEDDYVPRLLGFDAELLERYYSPLRQLDSKQRVLFCASWFDGGHAKISNGIMNVALFRKYGNEFYLNPRNVGHKNEGPQTQGEFLQSFAGKDLCIRNMAAEYQMPFLHNREGMRFYGNGRGSIVFAPVQLSEKTIEERSHKNPTLPKECVVVRDGGFHVLSGGTA
jgi:hypothetical protein